MTRLQIKNLNSNIELVDKNLISKLYQKAKLIKDYEELNNILNSLVDLIGNLLVDKAYGDEVDYLNTKFSPDLHINITTARYIRFEDPEVETRMVAKFGDGVGVTLGDVSGNIDESWGFKNNTAITKFNELGLFTNVTKITSNQYAFQGASNLLEIDLRNITQIATANIRYTDSYAFLNCTSLRSIGNTSNLEIVGDYTFNNCTSLVSVNLSNCAYIGYQSFKGCTSLSHVDFSSSPITFGAASFQDCSNLGVGEDLDITFGLWTANTFRNTGYKSVTLHLNYNQTYVLRGNQLFPPFSYMANLKTLDYSDTSMDVLEQSLNPVLTTLVLPSTFATLPWNAFGGTGGADFRYVIILAITPPTLESLDYMLHGNYQPNVNIYVPDSALNDYLTANNWSTITSRIKGLSELPVGVWKTGLYQLYEPYLSNSSDPAYSTT